MVRVITDRMARLSAPVVHPIPMMRGNQAAVIAAVVITAAVVALTTTAVKRIKLISPQTLTI
jgi:hypothetical protein